MAREVTLVDAGLGNIASVERALIQVGAGVRVSSDPDQVARSRMVVFPGQSAFGTTTDNIVDGAMGAALRMVIERGDPFLGICLGMQLLFDSSEENGGREGLHVLPGRCRQFPLGMVEARGTDDAPEDEAPSKPEPSAPRADPSLAQTELATAPGSAQTVIETVGDQPAAANDPPAVAPSMAATSTLTGSPVSPLSMAADIEEPQTAAPPSHSEEPQTPAVPENGHDETNPAGPRVRRLKVPHMGWNEVDPTGDHYYFVHSYFVEAERAEDIMWLATYGGIRFPAAVRRQNVLGCQFHPEKSQRAGLKFLRAFLLGGWG